MVGSFMPWAKGLRGRSAAAAAVFALAFMLSACGQTEYLYPQSRNRGEATRYGYGGVDNTPSVFGDGGLFGRSASTGQAEGGSGIGVNGFLWRAALDSISFMPIASADPFGGVIVTDWHALPESPEERFKINVFILGRELRADGVRAAVFRQRRDRTGGWTDTAVEDGTVARLEDAILTRAREMRLARR